MKRNSTLLVVYLCIMAFGFSAVAAQFTIKIPKIPKKEKPQIEKPADTETPPAGDDSGQTTSNRPASAGSSNSKGKPIYTKSLPNGTPVIIKSSIYIRAKQHDEYWKFPNQKDFTSWVPMIRFDEFYNNERSLNLSVEYFNPDGSSWFREKVAQTYESEGSVMFESPNPYEAGTFDKTTNGTGIYSFKITDQDKNQVIYQGKFKVGKFSRANRPTEKNKNGFYVEQDWLLPYGMVGFPVGDIDKQTEKVQVSIWLNGLVDVNELEGRVFYKGRQIATTKDGSRSSGVSDWDERAGEFAAAFKPEVNWKRWQFEWVNFRFHNNAGFVQEWYENSHWVDRNPGEYIVRIYRNGTQIREFSFNIGADGKFVAPGYMEQIFLPQHQILLPVKITGTGEKLNLTAWKTDSFYSNPLNGFTAF